MKLILNKSETFLIIVGKENGFMKNKTKYLVVTLFMLVSFY